MKLKAVTALLLAALSVGSVFGDVFKDVHYVHQTEKGKGKAEPGKLVIDATAKHISFDSKEDNGPVIPFDHITSLVYEKTSKPRYAAGLLIAWPLLFTKSKQHFLTIQYKDGDTGKYAVFHLDKSNYRTILASVESATGRKIDHEVE